MHTKKQLVRLKEILSVPTYFRKEHDLLRYLVEYLRTTDYTYDIDMAGNLYITKGKADYYPCVCAHTDSVQTVKDFTVEEVTYRDKLRLIGKREDGYQCGIGADDKAGVFVCMELLDAVPVIKVALFAGEEFGCVGSQNSRPEFFQDVGYVMEFDCPGSADVTHYCNGIQLFDTQADFYQRIKPILVEHMGMEPRLQHHPYTDVWPLKRMFDFTCINIATGYYRYHTSTEYVVVDEVVAAVEMGKNIIAELGYTKFEFKPPIHEINTYDFTIETLKKRYPDIYKTENNGYLAILQEEPKSNITQ